MALRRRLLPPRAEVRRRQHADTASEVATLAHAASGGGYSLTASLRPSLRDPDGTGVDYDTDDDRRFVANLFNHMALECGKVQPLMGAIESTPPPPRKERA